VLTKGILLCPSGGAEQGIRNGGERSLNGCSKLPLLMLL